MVISSWFGYDSFPIVQPLVCTRKNTSYISFLAVPEPENISVTDIQNDRAVVSYTIPTTGATIKTIEIRLHQSQSVEIKIIQAPNLEAPCIFDNLISGTIYNLRLRNIATDGRLSEFTATTNFTTGEGEILATLYFH